MSVNKVILLGYVGKDPEMRFPDKENAFAFFSLATDERQGGAQGATVTEWHNIVMTGQNASFAERYIRKGTRIYLEGRLRTRTWTDKYQMERRRTEIIVERFEILGRS